MKRRNTGTYSGQGMQPLYWGLDTPASDHNRPVLLSFGDGRAESHRWLGPATLGPIGVTGFRWNFATNRDIAWLQARAAEPAR